MGPSTSDDTNGDGLDDVYCDGECKASDCTDGDDRVNADDPDTRIDDRDYGCYECSECAKHAMEEEGKSPVQYRQQMKSWGEPDPFQLQGDEAGECGAAAPLSWWERVLAVVSFKARQGDNADKTTIREFTQCNLAGYGKENGCCACSPNASYKVAKAKDVKGFETRQPKKNKNLDLAFCFNADVTFDDALKNIPDRDTLAQKCFQQGTAVTAWGPADQNYDIDLAQAFRDGHAFAECLCPGQFILVSYYLKQTVDNQNRVLKKLLENLRAANIDPNSREYRVYQTYVERLRTVTYPNLRKPYYEWMARFGALTGVNTSRASSEGKYIEDDPNPDVVQYRGVKATISYEDMRTMATPDARVVTGIFDKYTQKAGETTAAQAKAFAMANWCTAVEAPRLFEPPRAAGSSSAGGQAGAAGGGGAGGTGGSGGGSGGCDGSGWAGVGGDCYYDLCTIMSWYGTTCSWNPPRLGHNGQSGGGTGGGTGGADGGGEEEEESSSESSEGGDMSANTIGGTIGGTAGFFSSAQRSRAPASSAASVAVSGEACVTTYVVPAQYVPDPTKNLGDRSMLFPGDIQQIATSGQSFAVAPWNFNDQAGIKKDFNVLLGVIQYAVNTKYFLRQTWTKASLNGQFSEPVFVDIPRNLGMALNRGNGIYDGKDTVWVTATEDPRTCKKEMVDNAERYLCNFIVQKTTVSTNTSQQIVIPNTTWLGATVNTAYTMPGGAFVASDGSLWFSIQAGDVLFNVRPDMSVRMIPFPSKGCTSVGRPVLRYGDAYCRGASRIAEGPDGSVWFTTALQAEGEKYPQIGIVKKDGTVKMVSFNWEDMIFVDTFYPGYDGAMWFTYTRPNMVETTLPDPRNFVARMTMAGELSFVQTPATVARMAAGKDGMWYLGNIITGAPPAQPTYKPVIGFLGKTNADSTLQTLPHDVFRRHYNLPLLVDKDNVPWTRVPNWKHSSAASSLTAQYYEEISTLPDTQSVIKFVCGPSSSPKSSSSSVSSSSSSGMPSSFSAGTSSSRASVTSVLSASSASSRPSSVGGSSLGGSSGVCPADPCGTQGSGYCGAFGLRCSPLSALPCFTCVLPQSSGASSVPQPSSARSSVGVTFSEPRSQGGMTGGGVVGGIGGIPPFPPRSAGGSSRRSDSVPPISVLRPQIEDLPAPSGPSPQQPSPRPPLATTPRPLPSTVLADRSLCGNGMQERGEECDDKNSRDFDGCSADCLLERGRCGDGIVQTLLDEQCEPSLHDASLPYGCSQDCRFASSLCGNGTVDEGEQCDAARLNSNAQNAFCRLDCSFARCGDGIIDSRQGEQCDDANRIGSDGCSARCTLERAAPSPLAAQVFTLPQAPGFPQSPVQTGPAGQGYTAQTWQVLPQATVPVTAASGPGALMVMAGGAAAGVGYMRRRRK